jgi:hypothetical protein
MPSVPLPTNLTFTPTIAPPNEGAFVPPPYKAASAVSVHAAEETCPSNAKLSFVHTLLSSVGPESDASK